MGKDDMKYVYAYGREIDIVGLYDETNGSVVFRETGDEIPCVMWKCACHGNYRWVAAIENPYEKPLKSDEFDMITVIFKPNGVETPVMRADLSTEKNRLVSYSELNKKTGEVDFY